MKWLSKLFKKKEIECDEELLHIHKTCIDILGGEKESQDISLARIENQINKMIKTAKTREDYEKITEIIHLTIEKYNSTTTMSNRETK